MRVLPIEKGTVVLGGSVPHEGSEGVNPGRTVHPSPTTTHSLFLPLPSVLEDLCQGPRNGVGVEEGTDSSRKSEETSVPR